MARTSKKAKVVTVATADEVANSVAEIVGALPAPEAEAVAAAETGSTPETVANGEIAFIPLNKLKKSPRNARKTPHSEADIEAYAASIAAKGILQNLVV
jgi:ParB family chromosome partitioning protein